MGIFGKKETPRPPVSPELYGKVYNYVKIDSINGALMNTYNWDYSDIKKGMLAKKVEIVYLLPGEYDIVAHGVTYQTTPTHIVVTIESDKTYILGAGELDDENEGLFFDERNQ